MRIAQISPLHESVPPSLYGGTERVVATLADALTDLGHDVTVFGSADSRTKAQLAPCRDRAIRLDTARSWALPAHLEMMEEVRDRAGAFDILHFHTDCLQMALFGDMAGRTLTTMHGRLDYKDLTPFLARHRGFPLVSISDSQRAPVAFANFVATIPHGMAPDVVTPPARPSDDYVAFLGRMSPDKRADRAIEIAKRAGWKIRLAAKIDPGDRGWFDEHVAPRLSEPHVEFVGEIGDGDKGEFLGNARALLFPIDWPEPFGLVMIEAMAAGTPVIAWPNGAAPEVVDEGRTGFLVDDLDAAAAAVERAGTLARADIRATFERRFSARAMAEGYVGVYRRLLARHPETAAVGGRHLAGEPRAASAGRLAAVHRSAGPSVARPDEA